MAKYVYYPVVLFDAIQVKVRSEAGINAMVAHVALGISNDGSREVWAIGMAGKKAFLQWNSHRRQSRDCVERLVLLKFVQKAAHN